MNFYQTYTKKKMDNITLVVPSHNNLRHLKNMYESIKKHAPQSEVILLDDGSNDGTWEWILELAESHQHREVKAYQSEKRVGHTILYDKGIEMATNDIVGILHADMIIGPNYVENLLKHLKPGKVVCATRIEPPLHPEGREKIIKDFGLDFDTLDIDSFEKYCLDIQHEYEDKTTNGMFAPWILYKKDFEAIGGHDPIFAPFPYEDSDLFQRWILNDYELIQSRDSLVYHLTCRGHRWTDEIKKDSDDFKVFEKRARKNYLRKWGSWVKNDAYQHPIISPVYHKTLVIDGTTTLNHIEFLEPFFNKILINEKNKNVVWEFLQSENLLNCVEPKVECNLDFKFNYYDDNDAFLFDDTSVVVFLDTQKITNDDVNVITNLNDIVKETNDIGEFEIGNLKVHIKDLKEYQNELIFSLSNINK
jgi:glycosyltransferase involved in cell wall biosynthesis